MRKQKKSVTASSRAGRKKLRNFFKDRGYSGTAKGLVPMWIGMETLEERLMLDTWHVEAGAVGGDGSVGNPFGTITQAITQAAATGDDILVRDGTYTEDLVINKSVTLHSVNGQGSTEIQLVDGAGIQFSGAASNNSVLGGDDTLNNGGFTITSHAVDTTFAIELINGPSGVTIQNNSIITTGAATIGISEGSGGADSLVVTNNTFLADGAGTDGAFWGVNLSNVTLNSNVILGSAAYGFQTSGVTGTSTISNNVISGISGSGGIVIDSDDLGSGTSGLVISGNSVTGGTNGIRFADYGDNDVTTVSVLNNTLTGNDKAIKIDDSADLLASNFTISANNLASAVTAGLDFDNTTSGETLDVSGNWWGSANGPTLAGANTYNVGSQGTAITGAGSGDVTFICWLDGIPGSGSLFAPIQNVDTGEYFSSFQAAIDDADTVNGNTLLAQDGTYTEDFDVSKDLTISSVNGAMSTTIQLIGGGDNVGIEILAAGVTLGGDGTLNNGGFEVLSGASTTFDVQLTGGPDGVTIRNNIINTVGNATMGISVGVGGRIC